MVDISWDERDVNNPTIVRMMLTLADIASSQRIRDILGAVSKKKEFVFHTLFLSFQMVFNRACGLLLSPDALSATLQTSVSDVDKSEFLPMLGTFEMVLNVLQNMRN